jgi:hypothetical protein
MSTAQKVQKPLGHKGYGSIPHLPGSRLGPGEHTVPNGQFAICCLRARDRHDRIIVTEKLDGSNTSVALVDGRIIALNRAGYPADSSPYLQHRMFAAWVADNEDRFRAVLREGERIVGEWLAQAHGTRYVLPHEPWVAFDLLRGHDRAPFDELARRAAAGGFTLPRIVHDGGPIPIEKVVALLHPSGHGALDPVEGAVWRVERRGKPDFLAKYVRPDKVDGIYLPEVASGVTKGHSLWNRWPGCEEFYARFPTPGFLVSPDGTMEPINDLTEV